ncbi:MAG: hypothetical protein KDI90_02445 [Alphaproteobacteria bacterium]|nr:hypothetical protein [Alphaproteobacteria bacterium]MCB9974416.1 hypothetical protein [Rhodospirillales bacterium]
MAEERQSDVKADREQGSVASHWIPVGHDVEEHDLPPLTALLGAILRFDDQKNRARQEFSDEALSDAASFVEIGESGVHALAGHSLVPLGDNPFAYISATAAIYLLTQIHREEKNQEGKLKNALELLDEYMRTHRSDVLHKAGLELEQVPNAPLGQETKNRTVSLLKVYEIGGRVAGTDASTAKRIADRLVAFGKGTRHALGQTFANAYWRNPRNIVGIFGSAVKAARVSLRMAHFKVTGKNEIHEDHANGFKDKAEMPYSVGKATPTGPIDLSEVVIEGLEKQDPSRLDPRVLEESLHIDEQYQKLLKDRVKFFRLAVIQGVFIGASTAQGVYNVMHGDGGWAFVNFSSASAAAGPFKFFADMFVVKDALLHTHRAEMGHKIAVLAGKESKDSQEKRKAKRDRDDGDGSTKGGPDGHKDRTDVLEDAYPDEEEFRYDEQSPESEARPMEP